MFIEALKLEIVQLKFVKKLLVLCAKPIIARIKMRSGIFLLYCYYATVSNPLIIAVTFDRRVAEEPSMSMMHSP